MGFIDGSGKPGEAKIWATGLEASQDKKIKELEERNGLLKSALDIIEIKYWLTVEEYHNLSQDFQALGLWTKEIESSFRGTKWRSGSYKVEEGPDKRGN